MRALFAGSSGTPAQYIAFTTIGNEMLYLNPPSTAGLSHNHRIRTANEGSIQPNWFGPKLARWQHTGVKILGIFVISISTTILTIATVSP
jgi:hypothetical protein